MENNKPGIIYLPYVLKTVSTSINGETVWYANKWNNLLLKIKNFFLKPKYLKNAHIYSKKQIDSSGYGPITIKNFIFDSTQVLESNVAEVVDRYNVNYGNLLEIKTTQVLPDWDFNKLPIENKFDIVIDNYIFYSCFTTSVTENLLEYQVHYDHWLKVK